MPELNVLCGIADYSTQSGQPLTKHLVVDVSKGGSAPSKITVIGPVNQRRRCGGSTTAMSPSAD